jgi:hypothetical protein
MTRYVGYNSAGRTRNLIRLRRTLNTVRKYIRYRSLFHDNPAAKLGL